MHAWHDIYVDDQLIESTFPVVIEVPMGSKNKYELDKETGFLRLDRVLYSAVVEDSLGPKDGIRILTESLDLYRKLRRGELSTKP